MLNHYEGYSAIGGHSREELFQRFNAARRSPDADDRKVFFLTCGGKVSCLRFSNLEFLLVVWWVGG
jgi:hypothetical protein